MHILGKVLLWLCVVLLIPTLVLITMTLDVRHRWLTDVAERQRRVENGLKQIAETQKKVRNLEEQRQALVHAWGDVWTSPNSQVQQGAVGALELGVGASSGLPHRRQGADVDPPVFVFADTPNGSQYLGEFNVTDIRPGQAIARMARAPYPQETSTWPNGTYRIRGTIPANWQETFVVLQHQLASASAALVDQQLELATRKQMVKNSQATLDQRMAELNGNPNAPADAGDIVRDGLVASVRKYESLRDQQLSTVDRLRRKMINEYNRLRHTISRCVEMADVLEKEYGQPDSRKPDGTVQNRTASSILPGSSVE
jgi:heme exporter protein D